MRTEGLSYLRLFFCQVQQEKAGEFLKFENYRRLKPLYHP